LTATFDAVLKLKPEPVGPIRVMSANFMSRINESASPSALDGFIAPTKTPARLNCGRRPSGSKRHETDL
jgi:hypothetical protein